MDNLTNPPEGQAAEQVKKIRIYTMPEKFHLEDKKSGGGKNFFLIIAIIVLVLLLAAGGTYYYLNKSGKKTNSNSNSVAVNNANANSNTNTNANANNANVNANLNRNSNVNTSTNLNNNLNIFTNFNANTNQAGNSNINANIASSQDSDQDGLTDVEEGLFGTSVINPDSDADGYADGLEVTGGYDPLGPGKLENSNKVKLYLDTAYNYSLLYPAAWVADDDPQNPGGKIFTAGDEFIGISIQDNPAALSARDWYLTKSPGVDTSKITTVTNWDKTLSGIKSSDGLTVYFVKGTKAYVINHNVNILTTTNYPAVFQLMYRSFKFSPVINVNANLNGNQNSNLNSNLNVNRTNANSSVNFNSNASSNRNTNTNTNTNTNSALNLNNRL